jgi:hypothetical protein
MDGVHPLQTVDDRSSARHEFPFPYSHKREAAADGERRAVGGNGVVGEPVPEREGDPHPPLPLLPHQRPGPVPASPPPSLAVSSHGDMVFARRVFMKKNYANIKLRKPMLPFLIRECSSLQPQLWVCHGKVMLCESDCIPARIASVRILE